MGRESEILQDAEKEVLLNEAKQRMRDQEKERLRNYEEFWLLFRGKHWDDSEEADDVPTPVFNKVYIILNKLISFLVGRPPTVNYALPEVETILAPHVNAILDASGGMASLSHDTAQMGFVSGDSFLKVLTLDSVQSMIQCLDSKDVFVRYPFKDYTNNTPSRAEITWGFIDEADKNKVRIYKEIWTKFQKLVLIDEKPQLEESGSNLLGEVPVVHIRNIKVGKSVYGMSDVEQLEPLNKLLNASIRSFMDQVRYMGSPITLLFGVRASSIERAANKLWGNLPLKSRVEQLTPTSDFPALQKFIDYLDEAIHAVGNVPRDSINGKDHISNTSGVALHINFLPTQETTDRKKIQYGAGLQKAIMLALTLQYKIEEREKFIQSLAPLEQLEYGLMPAINFSFSGILEAKAQIEAIYAKSDNSAHRRRPWNYVEIGFQSYLPKDDLMELQKAKDEMDIGIECRRNIMKRFGKDNIDYILGEVEKDREAAAKAEMDAMYKFNDTGTGGGDITQGMRNKTETTKGQKEE